jgi:hypothetical protein
MATTKFSPYNCGLVSNIIFLKKSRFLPTFFLCIQATTISTIWTTTALLLHKFSCIKYKKNQEKLVEFYLISQQLELNWKFFGLISNKKNAFVRQVREINSV